MQVQYSAWPEEAKVAMYQPTAPVLPLYQPANLYPVSVVLHKIFKVLQSNKLLNNASFNIS
jgi:hypothetical protein